MKTTTPQKVGRIQYPTVSLRLNEETRKIIEDLSQTCGCTQTSLVIYALHNLKEVMNRNPNIKGVIADRIYQLAQQKRQREIDNRKERNRERKIKGTSLPLGRTRKDQNVA